MKTLLSLAIACNVVGAFFLFGTALGLVCAFAAGTLAGEYVRELIRD